MAPWFYMPQLPHVGDEALLDEREARHAVGSKRLHSGDAVSVFDGMGNIGQGHIKCATGREVILVIASIEQQAPPQPRAHLAAALPKGDRQNVLLSMVTQLGMAAFTPLECTRSIVQPGRSFLDRTRRICIEACKQSRRAYLPEIQSSAAPAEFAAAAAQSGPVLIAHPGGRPAGPLLGELDHPQRIALLIGPEGGFTDDEVAAVEQSGGRAVSLGSGLLRVETAATALLSLAMLS